MTYLQILNELSMYLEEKIASGEDFKGIIEKVLESVREGKNRAKTLGDTAAEDQFKKLHSDIKRKWKSLKFSNERSIEDENQVRTLFMVLEKIKDLWYNKNNC